MKPRIVATLMSACLLCLLAACGEDKVIKRIEEMGAPAVSTKTISCMTSGYCLTCMPGLDLTMKCETKFSAFCPGRQSVVVARTPVLIRYTDNTSKEGAREEILSRGTCRR
jgi:hypothetical protein